MIPISEAFSILGDVKAHIRQNSLFCQRGKDLGKNLSMPLSDQSSYGDKSQAWNRRILGLPSAAGISLKAASEKEQEMLSGNTCDLSDF